MNEIYSRVRAEIDAADAILIGASNGLSISEGYNIFADDAWFQRRFADFRAKYGVRSVLQGCFFDFPEPAEKWAFLSRLIAEKSYHAQPSRMMLNLRALVGERDHFVITSNTEDHFAPAGFARENIFEMEGRMTRSRCGAECGAPAWENREEILRMAGAERDGRVPDALLPRCPRCGAPACIDTPDDARFFQTESFRERNAALQAFLDRNRGKRLLILEFGVGWRNQMIKAPLMRLTAAEPNARYVSFNRGELYIPEEIAGKSIGVDGDIADALERILSAGE